MPGEGNPLFILQPYCASERLPLRAGARRPIGMSAMQDLRRHKRIVVSLGARFLDENRAEQAASVIDISAGGLSLATPCRPPCGVRIVVYVDDIGRVEGDVVRHHDEGFAIRFSHGAAKQERLVEKITWAINREILGNEGDRRHSRMVVEEKTYAWLSDGSAVECTLMDVSLSGLSIAISPIPKMGEVIRVGRMHGRVVRRHEHGVAIEFLRDDAKSNSAENKRPLRKRILGKRAAGNAAE
jgi:hypothetical protein